jgi:hypothetical protein
MEFDPIRRVKPATGEPAKRQLIGLSFYFDCEISFLKSLRNDYFFFHFAGRFSIIAVMPS